VASVGGWVMRMAVRARLKGLDEFDFLIESRGVGVVFQPIAELDCREVVGFEAPARTPNGSSFADPAALFAEVYRRDRVGELDWVCRAAVFRAALAAKVPRGTPAVHQCRTDRHQRALPGRPPWRFRQGGPRVRVRGRGPVGKVTNAVNVVYATCAGPRGHALVGARHYMPREWADDPERRQRAGVPEAVVFRTKPQLALELLADLHTAGLAPPWATGDEVYGRDSALRSFCEAHDIGYVVEVPCSFRAQLTSGRTIRADQARRLVAPDGWNHRSAGPGSKGERRYAWAWVATTSPRHHLLIRRSLTDPTELAYFYTWIPQGRPVTLPTLVRVAGQQWCHDCNQPCVRVDLGGLCPNRDQPITIRDITDQH
jgi:hypothetical protein